jgi:hypothetical protein
MAGLFQNFFACKRHAEKGRADPAVFNKEMLLFENLISVAGSFQNFVDCKRYETSILWFLARQCSNSRIYSAWLAHSKTFSI